MIAHRRLNIPLKKRHISSRKVQQIAACACGYRKDHRTRRALTQPFESGPHVSDHKKQP